MMRTYCGLDIGGTKIGGALFDEQGTLLGEAVLPTPQEYDAFLAACAACVAELDQIPRRLAASADKLSRVNLIDSNRLDQAVPSTSAPPTIGVGLAGVVNAAQGTVLCANTPCLTDRPLREDIARRVGRPIRMANDANCMALAEAIDGAGRGCASVFGLILGTGVGGGFVWNWHILNGANGLAGEIGFLPQPFLSAEDPHSVHPHLSYKDCLDTTISGTGLSHLYRHHTGQEATAKEIADAARAGDSDSLRILDYFYDRVAKAMVLVLNTYDPDVIVVSGGLNSLPNLYEAVPQKWAQYTLVPPRHTRFLPAEHGPMSGRRGAAWLWRDPLA